MKLDLTVGACIVHGNKVLLLLHTKFKVWLFPGGHVDPNEAPDDAVVREVKEETGLDFIFLQKSPIVSSEKRACALPFHANIHNAGDHDHYCSYYLGTVLNPNFVRNDESQDMKWFTADEIRMLEKIPGDVRAMAIFALDKIQQAVPL